MPMHPGQIISHYRITDRLGQGGMGVVYRAEDTKLDRTVALKLLPPHALASEDDRTRFYREARAAAALSHPNIAHIYEIDEVPLSSDGGIPTTGGTSSGQRGRLGESRPFIAMEFIDGQALSDRIAKGPLPLKEAFSIAIQIAQGLKAAHEKNIVHRDVKSGNVMLTGDGVPKILDFGLAKTAASTKLTQMGSTLGTVAYMSPEQAKGEEVDRRSDIWSLGVILYEMITGRLPFSGDYEQAVVYGILNEDPESLTSLRAGVPLALDGILSKLLAKDPDLRYQHVDELPADLKAIDLGSAVRTSRISTTRSSPAGQGAEGGSSIQPAAAQPAGKIAGFTRSWPALLLVAATMFAIGWLIKPEQEVHAPLRKVTVEIPSMRSISFPTISPTSEWLAFTGNDTLGRTGIFLYEMAAGSVHHVEGSEIYNNARFSPDGDKLLLASWGNGAATMVIPNGVPNKAAGTGTLWHEWESNNTLVYTTFTEPPGIYRIGLDGGQHELVTPIDTTLEWASQMYVAGVLRDGLLIGGMQAPNGTRHAMALIDSETGAVTVGEEGVSNAKYVPGGHVLYQVGNDWGKVVVRRIDVRTGAFTGSPREILPALYWGGVDVGRDGSLVYAPGALASNLAAGLFLVTLDSRSVAPLNLSTTDGLSRPRFAPSGSEIALQVAPGRGGDPFIAVYDRDRRVLAQRTFGAGRGYPTWSADGRWIYYDDLQNIYRRPSDGSGVEELVLERARDPDVGSNGRWLVARRTGGADIVALDLETKRLVPVDTSAGAQLRPTISPSGRFVAYFTDVSGDGRIAVRPIEGSGYWVVTDVSSGRPRWSPDERFIYFEVAGDGVYRIGVNTSNGFRTLGEPEKVVSSLEAEFDVSPDGSVLAVTGLAVSTQREADRPATIVWWQNWAQSLPGS